jgi:hypothetical protein
MHTLCVNLLCFERIAGTSRRGAGKETKTNTQSGSFHRLRRFSFFFLPVHRARRRLASGFPRETKLLTRSVHAGNMLPVNPFLT